jgi:DNA-binding GntR family transcriptional regulator
MAKNPVSTDTVYRIPALQPAEALKQIDLPISIRDRAYESLKVAIVKGALKPGQRLIESQIAEILHVSRTPLREAIRRLEAEGFVERIHQGGVRVRQLTVQEAKELYSVRSVLEGLAAREAASRISQEQLQHLERIVSQMELVSGPTTDLEAIAQLGERFHSVILEASGNRKCADLLQLQRDHIDRYRHLTIAMPGRSRAAAQEHKDLLSVLRSRDPDAADEAMRRHVLGAGSWMLQSMGEAVQYFPKA